MMSRQVATGVVALAALALLLSGSVVRACDTPVYEYTIHMWDRDPYRVYYFHRGDEDPADKDVNRLLAETAQSDRAEANLWFTSVDVADPKAVGSGVVAKVWEKNKSRALPFHVVLTPRATELAVQRLTVSEAKALVDSPKRQTLADLLLARKQGVLVLLLGPKADENAKAQGVVKDVVAQAQDAEVDVGALEVKRDDATEKWLVRQLLNLEDDLPELDNTMLFGIFGRAHALEPFVGRGITTDNISELVYFMNGPCSCEVKAVAPGMDLLTKCDWNARMEGWQTPDEYFETTVGEITGPQQPKPTPRVAATARSGRPTAASPASTKPRTAPDRGKQTSAPAPGAEARPTAQQAAEPGTTPATPNPGAVTLANDAPEAQPALDEATRGPQLPPPDELADPAQPERPLAARMGVPLGIAVGVLAFGAVAGGAAVVWARRGQ